MLRERFIFHSNGGYVVKLRPLADKQGNVGIIARGRGEWGENGVVGRVIHLNESILLNS